MPVSYTHLDVYKRQGESVRTVSKLLERMALTVTAPTQLAEKRVSADFSYVAYNCHRNIFPDGSQRS